MLENIQYVRPKIHTEKTFIIQHYTTIIVHESNKVILI